MAKTAHRVYPRSRTLTFPPFDLAVIWMPCPLQHAIDWQEFGVARRGTPNWHFELVRGRAVLCVDVIISYCVHLEDCAPVRKLP